MEEKSRAEEETAVYSVWAAAPEPLKERLKGVMEKLRAEFGDPAFEPHVTDVGAIRMTEDDARRMLRSACDGIRPYNVRFTAVGRGTFFYQCVFLLVDPTPEVVEASAHSSSHFGYKSSSPYMPHLSLLYGDLADDVKERAKDKVKLLDPEICDLSFEVTRLSLYRTDTEDKSLKSWEKIEDCDLIITNN